MTKKQKVWLWVFLGLFALPEILWSPVANFYYEFWQSSKSGSVKPLRDNFLQNSDHITTLKFILLIEFIGLLGLLILNYKKTFTGKQSLKVLTVVLLTILAIAVGFALFLAFAFSPDIL